MSHNEKRPQPGRAEGVQSEADCGLLENGIPPAYQAQVQYTPAMACSFLTAVLYWHRDIGMVRAATLVEARRSALYYAFAEAAVHRLTGDARLDRLFVHKVIAGHTRHTGPARILVGDARRIAAHADAVAASFVDELRG